MTDTYAINVTRGQEFRVESEMQSIGLQPWVPRMLASKYVKDEKKFVWYDRPYVGKLIFCVIPAIYWPDVVGLKHVCGKPIELSKRSISGVGAYRIRKEGEDRGHGTGDLVPAVPGLIQFKKAVEDEYADALRKKKNGEYQCKFKPGQALTLLDGPFQDFPAVFVETVKNAYDEYQLLRVEVQIFGRATPVEVAPDKVEVA